MAIRRITSDPKPSVRHSGWLYAYYSKPTANGNGGDCAVIFPPVLADIVKKGFCFDDSCVAYNENLRASVLHLDFGMEEAERQDLPEPSFPPDLDTGWADPDGIPAEPVRSGASDPLTSNGIRPGTIRKRAAAEAASHGNQLPPALMKMGMEISRLFLMQYALLSSIPESNRALIAQKLAVTAAIPYYRATGVNLGPEEAEQLLMV
jgi:hypothetical protein